LNVYPFYKASQQPDDSLQPQAHSYPKLFMKAKEFGGYLGAPYCRVLEWIHQGMPVVPDARSPYLIIVPSAMAWLSQRYGFKI